MFTRESNSPNNHSNEVSLIEIKMEVCFDGGFQSIKIIVSSLHANSPQSNGHHWNQFSTHIICIRNKNVLLLCYTHTCSTTVQCIYFMFNLGYLLHRRQMCSTCILHACTLHAALTHSHASTVTLNNKSNLS